MSECHILSFPIAKKMTRLGGGRNNRVVVAEYGRDKSVIKSFSIERQREGKFAREVAFLEFCRKLGPSPVPKLINQCKEHGVLETSFEAGSTREVVDTRDVGQLVGFLRLINSDQAVQVGGFEFEALEYVDSIIKFEETINSRRQSIRRVIGLTNHKHLTEIENVISIIENYLMSPEYNSDIRTFAGLLENTRKTIHGHRFLSPSDFGSHNILKKDGSLIFFDFEYSGYDSGVNLLGDTLTQPDTRWAEGARQLFASRFMLELFGINLQSSEPLERLFALRWTLVMVMRTLRVIQENEHLEAVMALNFYSRTNKLAHYGG